MSNKQFEPVESLAQMRHEFGEHGGVNMSIEASTTFSVLKAETLPAIFQGQFGPEQGGCYLYGRHYNPTVYTLGKQIAHIEGAEAGYCTSSGLSAISSTLLQLCNSGDHIVSSHTVYGGTYALMHDYLPLKNNIKTTFVDTQNLTAVENAITNQTKVLYVETMSNPTLQVSDIPALAKLAKQKKLTLVVDNTFSPLIISPLKLGADIVVHSMTKFINGASDVIAGAVCGPTAFIQQLMDLHTGSLMLLGPTMDPHCASAISLRLPHLALRMIEHSRRAQYFAERLSELGFSVLYPGLENHSGYRILKKISNQQYGAGGILCVDLKTLSDANRFIEVLQNQQGFGIMAVSLGYAETLMTCPAASTSSEMTSEDLQQAGISPGLVRLSIGYTGTLEQRWQQMKQALSQYEQSR
jgi:methionine-gamma-lyase